MRDVFSAVGLSNAIGGKLWDYSHYHHARRAVLVGVPNTRPLNLDNVGETLAADLVWRRTHTAPFPADLVKDAFERKTGREVEKVVYDRYGFCTMCPCSPCYKVTLMDAEYYGYAVHIELTAEDLKASMSSILREKYSTLVDELSA